MLKLVSDSNPILKQQAEPWAFNAGHDAAEVEEQLISTMVASNGIGLAANQVGLLKRVFAIALADGRQLCMFNPKLISQSKEIQIDIEGCLSFPDLWIDIPRPVTIVSEYLDKSGKECTIELSNIDARCFLHELDHLDGICFTEKISPLKLALARKKQLQRKRNGRAK
jgi:peptide deformylase